MKEQTQETRTTEAIMISRAEYEELKSQSDWLMEQPRLLKKKRFGASSEQTKEPLDGQMSLLFNETEVREMLKLIPAKAILRRDVYYAYAGENCKKALYYLNEQWPYILQIPQVNL